MTVERTAVNPWPWSVNLGFNQGELVSPVIDLTGVERPRLTYAEWLEVESGPGYDQLAVEVFDVDQPSVVIARAKTTGTTHGVFVERLLALDGLAGRRVRIRFRFRTIDATATPRTRRVAVRWHRKNQSRSTPIAVILRRTRSRGRSATSRPTSAAAGSPPGRGR